MELPLFPLNTVLFPGAMLPLHIFEERYKLMIASCIEERRPFGVLLIREGWEVGATAEPFEVGTTAHIARVDELEEGKMDLVCLGGKRFRTVRLVSEDPYLTGEVEFLSSTSTDDPKAKELSDDAGSLFAEYVRLYLAISNQWARSVEMPGEPDGLADFIGARLGVAPQVTQRAHKAGNRGADPGRGDPRDDAARRRSPHHALARLRRDELGAVKLRHVSVCRSPLLQLGPPALADLRHNRRCVLEQLALYIDIFPGPVLSLEIRFRGREYLRSNEEWRSGHQREPDGVAWPRVDLLDAVGRFDHGGCIKSRFGEPRDQALAQPGAASAEQLRCKDQRERASCIQVLDLGRDESPLGRPHPDRQALAT